MLKYVTLTRYVYVFNTGRTPSFGLIFFGGKTVFYILYFNLTNALANTLLLIRLLCASKIICQPNKLVVTDRKLDQIAS